MITKIVKMPDFIPYPKGSHSGFRLKQPALAIDKAEVKNELVRGNFLFFTLP
jgi:hypothetical protein